MGKLIKSITAFPQKKDQSFIARAKKALSWKNISIKLIAFYKEMFSLLKTSIEIRIYLFAIFLACVFLIPIGKPLDLNVPLFIAVIGLLLPISKFVQKFWKYTLIKFIVLIAFSYLSTWTFATVNQLVSNVVGVSGHYFIYTLSDAAYELILSLLRLDSLLSLLFLLMMIVFYFIYLCKAISNKPKLTSFIVINSLRLIIFVVLIITVAIKDTDKLNENYENAIASNVYEYDMYDESVCKYDLKDNQRIKRLTNKTALLAVKYSSEYEDCKGNKTEVLHFITFDKVPCVEAQDE